MAKKSTKKLQLGFTDEEFDSGWVSVRLDRGKVRFKNQTYGFDEGKMGIEPIV